ncbi:hypothetical protein [Bartonella gabonensis]|uniref:hypothetical protein n=1 Tax=Bartonella gabonensis TaxID=2699889 RepID=UPI001FE8E0A8|nr:hypothetical protein [Bartonella gabonensis]
MKERYLAFDKSCDFNTVKNAINTCRENDKEEKKDLSISEEIPTFEEAYKLGAKEWMRSSNEKCFDQLFYWDMFLKIENAKDKLQYIFGEEQLKKLEEAINK